jgi:hypothetical protein
MLNREPLEQDALRAALGRTEECPTIEELEFFAFGEVSTATNLIGHLQACAYCQTELHLLQTFLAEEAGYTTPGTSKAAALLRRRSKEIFQQAFTVRAPAPLWKAFTVRRMAQASLAAAAILLIAAAVVFFQSRTDQPQLEAKNQTGQEVLRSGSFAVLSPAGDLQERPKEIRWEQVAKATGYQVRILEVDRSEMWKAKTTVDYIELPAGIRDRIVPSKTLFAEIMAFDSSGNQVGTTGLVRFRLLRRATEH